MEIEPIKRILACTLLALTAWITLVKAAEVSSTAVTNNLLFQHMNEITRYVREWILDSWNYWLSRRRWVRGCWATVWRRGWS